MTLELRPRKLVKVLAIIVGLVILADVLTLISTYAFGRNYVYGLVPLFSLDQEQNVPTFVSSAMWLLSASLAFAIAAAEKTRGRSYLYWAGLCLICLYISLDEFAEIHERFVNAWIRGPAGTDKPFYMSWVLVYGPLVVVIAVLFGRFVLRLPAEIRRLIIIAGVTYVFGAIGFEEISGVYLKTHDWSFGLGYNLVTLFEETLEMTAVVMLIYALMSYAAKYAGGLSLRIATPRAE